MAIFVAKADGTSEPFKPHKLLESLERAGADRAVAQDILTQVESELYSGMTTQEIYRHAFSYLRRARHNVAARYSLKRAILDFGPSGFPFEAFIAELYRFEGYKAITDQVLTGGCVEHEVDVVLTKGEETVYVEAKFHNTLGFKTDLKTVLYVKARLDDLEAARNAKHTTGHMRGLIVTNTKFTDMALRYASCSGVELLGWEHPIGSTLFQKIERAGLYPVTALTTLGRKEKLALLGQRIVLCNSLPHETRALAAAGVQGKKAEEVLEEVASLCVPGAALVE